jgi:3-oxoadipate enol-lactonase
MLCDAGAGTRLHLVDEGTGDPVLFLHGGNSSWEDWKPQFDALRSSRRCIAVDLRGHGRSDRAADGYGIAELADDVAGVCRALDLGPTDVAGLSLGGMVAQALAIRHPELVRSLVLVGTTGFSDPAGLEMLQTMAGAVRSAGLGALVDAYETVTWSARTRAEQPDLVEAWRRRFVDNDAEVAAAVIEAIATLDHRPDLGGIKVPTLVVWGADDGIFAREQAQFLADAIPEGQLVVLPDAGHYSNLEAPERFNTVLTRFYDTAIGRPS